MATPTRSGTIAVGRTPAIRSGSTTSSVVVSGSVSKINPATHRGTIAVGRPGPTRTGTIAATLAPSGSRSTAGAASYTRTGLTATAQAPAGTRTITAVGNVRTRSATLAVGRIPTFRSGSTTVGTSLSGTRVIGNPGAMFDRTGTVVTGRIATTRSGTVATTSAPSGSRAFTPAGVYDRTGGNAGGAGASTGLLLTLQVHPGAKLSGSVRVDSNVPLRTGIVITWPVIAGAADVYRSRSGVVIVELAPSGSRAASGNRNRNGLTRTQTVLSATTTRARLSERTAALVSGATLSATAGRGITPVYARSAAVAGRTVHTGRRTIRPRGAKTYIWAPISTGYIAAPNEEGVVVA